MDKRVIREHREDLHQLSVLQIIPRLFQPDCYLDLVGLEPLDKGVEVERGNLWGCENIPHSLGHGGAQKIKEHSQVATAEPWHGRTKSLEDWLREGGGECEASASEWFEGGGDC